MITATHAPTNIVCCNTLNPDRKTICQPPFFPTQAHTYFNSNESRLTNGFKSGSYFLPSVFLLSTN